MSNTNEMMAVSRLLLGYSGVNIFLVLSVS